MQYAIGRREFMQAGTFGLCSLALGVRAGAGEARKRPNVLLITTDQQSVDVMSALGNPWAKTPNMDAIAAHGVYFRNSYCPYPLCSPSRATLHTSRMPHEIGVDHNGLSIANGIPLSGQVLGAAGYDTGYAGKWHLPESYPADGIAGFEVLNKISRIGRLAHDVDESTMTAAIEFLGRKRDQPFFLVVSFINPHDICLLAGEDSPLLEEVRKKYEPAAGTELPPLPANFARTAGEPASLVRVGRNKEWDETHWRKYRHAYHRLLEDVDRQVGQIMDALRRIGQEDQTLVVFTSDHGEGQGAHQRTGKMMYYEEEVAVPLIVSWKGVTPAGRIDRSHLVSALDVLPTICDYAGVKPPDGALGRSLRTVMEKPDDPGREFVVAEMAAGGYGGVGRSFMVRTKKHKYMVFPTAERCEMLFDLEADPGEMKNLANEAALTGELERHRKLLAEWKQTTAEDRHPIKTQGEKPRKKARKGAAAPA